MALFQVSTAYHNKLDSLIKNGRMAVSPMKELRPWREKGLLWRFERSHLNLHRFSFQQLNNGKRLPISNRDSFRKTRTFLSSFLYMSQLVGKQAAFLSLSLSESAQRMLIGRNVQSRKLSLPHSKRLAYPKCPSDKWHFCERELVFIYII